MSTVKPVPRHALGLPAGSVRATHVLMVVGLICLIILMPTRAPTPIPPYLAWLMLMLLGHFFTPHGASHGLAAGDVSRPLYLPTNLIRLIIIAALAGTIGWKLYQDPAGLERQYDLTLDALKAQPFLPLILLGGFFFGALVRMVVGREAPPMALQDLEAWVSLIALVGLFAAVIIHAVINPTLSEPLSLPHAEAILASLIAFYFGERS